MKLYSAEACTSVMHIPATVKLRQKGYHDLTVEIAKETVSYNDVYTATVKKDNWRKIQRLHTQRWQRASNGTVALDKKIKTFESRRYSDCNSNTG